MKMVFDFGRLARYQPMSWVACLTLALAVTIGCGKSSPPPESTTPPVSTDSTTAQPTAPPAPVPLQEPQLVVAAAPDDTQKTLQGLNRALMGWMIRNHRHPKTFEEFAASSNTQIPAPPAGQKYTLNARGFVILVSN